MVIGKAVFDVRVQEALLAMNLDSGVDEGSHWYSLCNALLYIHSHYSASTIPVMPGVFLKRSNDSFFIKLDTNAVGRITLNMYEDWKCYDSSIPGKMKRRIANVLKIDADLYLTILMKEMFKILSAGYEFQATRGTVLSMVGDRILPVTQTNSL